MGDFIKLLLYPVFEYARTVMRTMRLKMLYRTLKIRGKVLVVNVKFGQYNYLSSNVTLVNCVMGSFSYVGVNSSLENVNVGKFTCIGPNAQIGLGNHPIGQFVSIHPAFYSKQAQCGITFSDDNYFEEYEKVSIGNDVWIGASVIVKGGVKIGDGAVIATGAVVVKDVAPYSVVGGIPARHIRFRFAEDEIKDLLALKWWDRDMAWLQENAMLMRHIENLEILKQH